MPEASPICLICLSQALKRHFYPPNLFNGKYFHYYKCLECHSLSIHPIPDKADMDKIYGVNDHNYLADLPEGQKLEYDFKYPNYNYHKYQLEFLKEDLPFLSGNKLLDFACGSGFYMAFSKKLGLVPTGVEYDKAFAGVLRDKTGLDIHPFEEFTRVFSDKTFDVIHLGHILEHLPEPRQTIHELKKYAHAGTIFIIDGPLENNACLTRSVTDIVSKAIGREYNEYAPQHLTFTNYSSQLDFFEKAGLDTLRYFAREQYFPFPEKVDLTSPGNLLKFMLSRISIQCSKVIRKQGNIFHYAGKLAQ